MSMKDIVSSLRVTLGLQRSSGNASNGPEPNTADAAASNRASGSSADLYECPACNTVLIEPASEECSQCPGGTLTKV